MTKIPKDVLASLGPGEEVELFVEKKIYHPKINVDSMVLTNERIIFRHPQKLKLKKNTSDLSYTDLANPTLESGPLRSKITLPFKAGGKPVVLDRLSNPEAEKAVGVIRSNIARYQTPFSAGYPGVPVAVPAKTPAAGLTCKKCGRIGRSDAQFCDACGSKLK